MERERITYKQSMGSAELSGYVKAIALPIGVFLLAMFVISEFGAFGTNILAPFSAIIWLFGGFVAWKIPSQRAGTLKEVHICLAGYFAGLYLLRFLIGAAANTSSEQLMASYSQPMPQSSAATISGFLQQTLWITSFMAPLTFLGMLGKKLVQFKRSKAKNIEYERIRGMRER